MLLIRFIYHSCFAVETDTALVVLDYSKDDADGSLHKLIESRGARQLYFVVSHFHEDHYNAEVLDFADARLLVSYDTQKRRRIPKELPVAILRPGDTYEDENLTLHAYNSTDVGISTLTTLPNGTTIYHAGDNNNWYFADNPEDHLKTSLSEMEGLFISILRDISGSYKTIDHAMFPVDPRLGTNILRGPFQWLWHVKTKHFYPMHCWEQWDTVKDELLKLKEQFSETEIHLQNKRFPY